ncbi:MAG TPA: DUF6163 family protein [Methylocella sp.]|nr:DUF6163 family protein [Methylocella sp.]
MRFWRGQVEIVPVPDTGAAIRLGEPMRRARDAKKTDFLLVAFMRLLAVLWALQGLLQWSVILLPPEPLFDKVSSLYSAAVIFFAVLDLVASVGLWLAAPWGSVIWLFSAVAQLAAVLWLPDFYSGWWGIADAILIALYFALIWQAGQPVTSFRAR